MMPPNHMDCKNKPINCIYPECSCRLKEIKQNIAEKAIDLVSGDRAKAYGNPLIQARRVCLMWEAITGHKFTPKEFELCMLTLKISREVGKEQEDNLVDIVGYALVLERVYKLEREEKDTLPHPELQI